ncbi:hypothetical protein MUN77_01650 [Leucobacter allii]|uniref:hypothetical protein n=1 Tax=Leucobacter allii TaxID=2932247 RepID=UPI001FD3C102|nr:hypothetical protein [Leucobacter allii]UOR02064.1 hypothetical protein MUN77_01650 [Leucobacter allii]
MSIRGRGPHDLIVQPRKITRVQGSKLTVNDGAPVLLKRCDVQSVREWATSEEDLSNGITLLSLRRVFARKWVGDSNALVYFDGGVFEIVGDPQRLDRTRRTAHWLVTIRWLGNETAPTVPTTP